MKRVIKESQLRQIIRESLVSILNEHRTRQTEFPSIDEIKGVQVYVADPSKCANAANRDAENLRKRFLYYNALNSKVDENGGVYAWFEDAGDAEAIWRECLGEPRFSPNVIQLERDVPLNKFCADNHFDKYYAFWKQQYEQFSNNEDEDDDYVDDDYDVDNVGFEDDELGGNEEDAYSNNSIDDYDNEDYFV